MDDTETPQSNPSGRSRDAAEEYTSATKEKTRQELEVAKEYAEMIVDTIREGLLVLDLDLRVKSANRSFYDLFETTPEETEGRKVYELGGGQWDIPELRELLEEILPERKSFDDFEVARDFEDAGERVMLLNARRLNHHQMILLAIEDITERRRTGRELRQSQERFDLFIENAKEYAIFMMDEDTTITLWNPGAERVLGWKEEEVLGQKGDIIFTEEDCAAGVPEKELKQAKREGAARDDRWHVRQDGSHFWATGFMVALRDEEGELRGLTKIVRDDTEQQEAKEEREALLGELHELNETLEERVAKRTRQVRELATTLTMVEQQERRRISQILHDDLQQQLYGIGLKMTFIRRHAEAGRKEQLLADIDEAEEWLSQGVELTRNLTVDLSPPILQDEGLADALQWLRSRMKELYGLNVDIEADHAFWMPEEDMRVLLFQIVRELLFNIVKHAGAKQAAIKLKGMDHHLEIVVTDSGKGFDVEAAEAQAAEEGGFGLFSVRERLGLFGGRVEIDSKPGEGTRVTLSVPLQPE